MTRIFSYQDDNWTPPGALKPGSNIVCNDIGCLPGAPNAKTGSVDPRQLSHVTHGGGHDHDMYYFFLDGSLQSRLSEGRLTLQGQQERLFRRVAGGLSAGK